MPQPISYPRKPQDYLGSILRPKAYPLHEGWIVTDCYQDKDTGSGCTGYTIALMSLHNGERHTERWGVVCQGVVRGVLEVVTEVEVAVCRA